jgi:hypothetical protein
MIAQIYAPYLRIIAQFLWPARTEYFPMIHDVCAVRHLQSFPHIMIGDQHADPGAAQVADNFL